MKVVIFCGGLGVRMGEAAVKTPKPMIPVGGKPILLHIMGINASIGERLLASKECVGEDELFLSTYGDGLTDAPLDDMISRLVSSGKTGLFMTVRPRLSYHVVHEDEDGHVRSIEPMAFSDVRINGGFFVLRNRIFDDIWPGEDVMDAAARLARQGDLIGYPYNGFWAPMDTLKDKQDLDDIAANGDVPWLWSRSQLASA